MYTINLITEDSEVFTFQQKSEKVENGNIFVIGNKIVFNGLQNFIFELLNYKRILKQVVHKTHVYKIEIKNDLNYKIINMKKLLYIVFVDKFLTKLHEKKALIQNSYFLKDKNVSSLIYLDFLTNPLQLKTLINYNIELLSYGTVFHENKNKTACRLVMQLNLLNLDNIMNKAKDIFVVNIRFAKDYQKPGCVVVFQQNGRIINFFQCICCKNTNRAIKHLNDDVQLRKTKDTVKKKKKYEK